VVAVDDLPVAQPDAVTTDEATAINGSVFVNNGSGADSDPDGPTLSVSAVNGSGLDVGSQITLGSGALLTLNANGTFNYDPNHAFDATPAAGSGAANTPAHDSFTYTLAGGGTTTVSITVNGLDTNDSLHGSAGPNTFSGGSGNDTYYVDDSGDLITEAVGAGDDQVIASVGYILNGGAEVEQISTSDSAGTQPIYLDGNEFAQTLTGNAGNNYLDGGGGGDVLIGGAGDDAIIVNSGDIVVEAIGGGYDNVAAKSNYILNSGAEVEVLSTSDNNGTAPISLNGNEFDQVILGNAGNNYLDGGGGADLMVGGAGDDAIIVEAGDRVVEAVGGGYDNVAAKNSFTLNSGAEVEVLSTTDNNGNAAINLTGNEFGQVVLGNLGNNVLDGGLGDDLLVGLAGADTFAFTTALGPNNVDRIADFTSGSDKIALDHSIFDQLATGAVPASVFHVGPAATNEDQRIIYDNSTGNLYYDADGSGSGAAILFATLDHHPVVTASDFTVI
jgi:VCBS repeat-containing protein